MNLKESLETIKELILIIWRSNMNNSCDEKLSKSIKNIEKTLNSIKDRLEKKKKKTMTLSYIKHLLQKFLI